MSCRVVPLRNRGGERRIERGWRCISHWQQSCSRSWPVVEARDESHCWPRPWRSCGQSSHCLCTPVRPYRERNGEGLTHSTGGGRPLLPEDEGGMSDWAAGAHWGCCKERATSHLGGSARCLRRRRSRTVGHSVAPSCDLGPGDRSALGGRETSCGRHVCQARRGERHIQDIAAQFSDSCYMKEAPYHIRFSFLYVRDAGC